jgi:hypothetical protein
MDADAFLTTLREEVLAPAEYADTSAITGTLSRLEPGISALEAASSEQETVEFFNVQGSYEIAGHLLGTPAQWLQSKSKLSIARQLQGWREWLVGARLRDVIVGVLLAEAHRSRAQRRRRKFTEIVADRLNKIASNTGVRVKTAVRIVGRTFGYILEDDTGPLVAVVDIFQTRAGGRQQDLFLGLPDLQASLVSHGVTLLVIADGPGFRGMGQVVRRVAPQLSYFTNLNGLETPTEVPSAIETAKSLRLGFATGANVEDELLSRIAMVALKSGRPVNARTLRLDAPEFEAFLLRFQAMNPDIAVSSSANELHAEAEHVLNQMQEPTVDPSQAVVIRPIVERLASWLGAEIEVFSAGGDIATYGLRLKGIRLRLPDPLPMFVPASAHGDLESILPRVDQLLATGELMARVGVILAPTGGVDRSKSPPRANRASQIVLLESGDVADIFLRKRGDAARRYFVTLLLRDVDLSLVSPFVAEGPTPTEMFFGRDREIRRIVEQIHHQSFALVGGRKAGKTSILQQLRGLLPSRLPVLYVDCQAHPDRQDFLDHLVALTSNGIRLDTSPSVTRAEYVLRSVSERCFGDQQGVLLLDEVDDLFLGDSTADQYPHVLSRALRALSQQRQAMIVATGERTLFSLTRDPSSPHWNFCTPIRIGPLPFEASRNLLRDPLATLGIDVTEGALNECLDITACHPNLLQYLGSQVIEKLMGLFRPNEAISVGESLVNEIASSYDFRNRFLVTHWSQATSLEKVISLMLDARNPKSVESIYAELSEGASVSPTAVADAMNFLQLYSIADDESGGFRLRSPAFDRLYEPMRGSAMSQQWLREVGT